MLCKSNKRQNNLIYFQINIFIFNISVYIVSLVWYTTIQFLCHGYRRISYYGRHFLRKHRLPISMMIG